MKIRKQIVLNLLATLLGCTFLLTARTSTAAGFVDGPHFFYPAVEDADGWEYKIPECTKIPDREFHKLKRQCRPATDHSKRCPTEKTVTLKNIAPPTSNPVGAAGEKAMEAAQKVDETTKTFKIDYYVFLSEKQCKEDREAAMKPTAK